MNHYEEYPPEVGLEKSRKTKGYFDYEKLKNEDFKKIAKLVDEGYSSRFIANKYNYSKEDMHCIIARHVRYLMI